MSEFNGNAPGLITLARKMGLTALAALHNRGHLFLVELQEEKHRAIELLIWAMTAFFMAIMFVAVLTATIIWLVPSEYRIYAAGGFCILYLAGAVFALLNLKGLTKACPPPFSDSIAEVRKDREWLESLR